MAAIMRPSISQRFLVVYVTVVGIASITIAFVVVAGAVVAVIAGILSSLLSSICPQRSQTLRLKKAIARKQAWGSRLGFCPVLDVTLGTKDQEDLCPDWRGAMPGCHHLYIRI